MTTEKSLLRREGLSVAIIVGDLLFALWAYPQLPDRVATHFNAAGQPDGYSGPAFAAFFFPLLITAIYVLMLAVPRIDPRRANYERFGPTYDVIRGGTIAFLAFIHVTTMGLGLGWPINVGSAVMGGVGLLFAMIGNQLPRILPTYMVGIRTPWTLESPEVWRRTHRLAGPIWLIGGIAIAASGIMAPKAGPWVLIGSLVLMIGVPTAASFLWWTREQREQHD